MAIVSLLFGVFITVLNVIKSFMTKKGTRFFSSNSITFSNALFMVAILCVILPFNQNYFSAFNDISKNTVLGFTFSILKGFSLYISIKYIAELARESNSSSVFAGFISLGIGSVVNSQLLSDNLAPLQLFACIALGILGVVFFFCGPVNDLSKKGKLSFICVTLVIVFNMMSDKIATRELNWFAHLFISNLVFFFVCLFRYGKNISKLVNDFKNPLLTIIGLLYFIENFIVLYTMGVYLPVSLTNVFMRLAAPITMILSSYIYKERTPREQLLFGGLALLFAFLILFK